MMSKRFGWIYAALAVALPLAILITPHGEWRLAFDSSTESISGSSQKLDERLMLLLRTEAPLSAADIALIDELSVRARLIPGVTKLRSISLAEVPFGSEDSLELETLPKRLDRSPSQAKLWLKQAFEDPLIKGQLVSADARSTRLVFVTDTPDRAASLALARQIEQLVRATPAVSERFDWSLTGAPLVRESISALLLDQLQFVLPLILLIFVVVLGASFRSVTIIVTCLITLATGLLWTLAGAVVTGLSINMVTVLVPPLVLTLGLAICMHVVSAYAEQGSMRTGLESIRVPLMMSSITTAAGLAALAFNPVPAIQQFAFLGVLGTLFATLAAVSVLPWLLGGLSQPPTLWPPIDAPLVRGANRVSRLVSRNSTRVIGFGIGMCAFSLIGVFQVETGAKYISDLPVDNEVRLAVESISQDFGGASGFDIEIAGAGRDAILLPDVLKAIDSLQQWLEADGDIGGTTSPVDYIKRIHQAMTDGKAESYRIPDDAALIKQLLVFGGPDEMYDYTDLGFSRMRINVVTPLDDTRELSRLLQRVTERLQQMPPGIAPTLSGDTVELVKTVDRLTGGQAWAISLAAASILLALTIMFASLRVAAMAMLPNMLPVFVFFALMGFSGTVLSPTTALVACIVLGIAVDDTLHLLGRFNRLAKLYADEERACHDAVKEVIRPITLTTVTVVLGFLSLANSPFHSHTVFSLFAAATLVLAWASDLFIAPAIAVRAPIVTLWDRILLDLGRDPEKTIPLFAGMTPRQARTFGLIASVRDIPAGETFIELDRSDDSMFVVLDGEVRIWLPDSNGHEMELARLSRGATIGEVGHFRKRRSANASAIGPVRLMQFDAATLERVLNRHPRIGGRAYQNLNRIQADYRLKTMERLSTNTGEFRSI